MRIPFEKRRDTVIPAMYGGEGAVSARMYVDGDNKIMEGVLAPGCSIGLHSHQNSSEIVYILSGTGKALFDDLLKNSAYAFEDQMPPPPPYAGGTGTTSFAGDNAAMRAAMGLPAEKK